MDWLEYYIDALKYEEKDLKESYSRLMRQLNAVIDSEDRMKSYPSECYFIGIYYQEVSSAIFEIDYIQHRLIRIDELRGKIREEIKKKTFSE